MNKTVIAALMSSASAQSCNFQEGDIVSDAEFFRMVTQATYRGYIRGQYLSDEDVVSDECFGDWMGPEYNRLVGEAKEAMKDPLAVPLEGYTQWASDAVELVFKNKDTCAMTQIYDDFRGWCMEDEMRCFFSKGIEDRVINNAVGLVSTIFEIGKFMVNDDHCYTDAQFADELGSFLEDFGKMSSYTTGFNHPWGAIGAAQHFSPEEFESAADEFFTENQMTPRAILEMNWPKTLELIDTAQADFSAINDWLIQPVVEQVEYALLVTGYYTYWYIYDLIWSFEITAYFVEEVIGQLLWYAYDVFYMAEMFVGSIVWTAFYSIDLVWQTILAIDDMLYDGLMSVFYVVAETLYYSFWVLIDLAYFGVYGGVALVEYAVYGTYETAIWLGDNSSDLIWDAVWTVEDLYYFGYYSVVNTLMDAYYELDWDIRVALSMFFGCETWEVYDIGFDLAGMHVPYWMVIVGFVIFW